MAEMTAPRDPFIFTLVLKPVAAAVEEARGLIAFAWEYWELGDDYSARLVISELVTNALQASAKDQFIVVRAYLRNDGEPILEVWDESPEPVVMRTPDLTDTNGRGLFIIDALTKDWQVHPLSEGGKVIRVEMVIA